MKKPLRSLLFCALPLLAGTAHAQIDFQPDLSTWYPFNGASVVEDNALGLSSWNAEPAGAQGRLMSDGEKLVYGGEEIKLWGVNNEYSDCFPPKEAADFRAAFYARQGFNSLRQHKYNDGPGWAGFSTDASMTEFDPEALDRFDYFNAKLIEHGLFLNLSSNFGVKYGPADAERFEAHEDFAKGDEPFRRNSRIATGHGSVWLSPGLQELHIEQLTKLLEHTNPYTGRTYAEEPGIAFVEIFNEDSVLFYSTIGKMRQSPIMREYASKRFGQWLQEKYGDASAWREAWGDEQIVESLDSIGNNQLKSLLEPDNFNGAVPAESFENGVLPAGQPWFYDRTAEPSSEQDAALAALRPRLLDTMEFLISLQDEFYDNTVAAIRQTGYEGEIIASNWQAGSMTGHYWNLLSDRRIGLIDRHNYFGGGVRGLRMGDNYGPGTQASHLHRPGSELLSSGLQQVADRPFMLSEWNVVQPTEWYAEGPAIIGAYGMGLQGWDASYIFGSYQDAGYAPHLHDVKKFSIDTPATLGVMPAVSRMVRRGDVEQSERLAVRPVSMEALRTGEFSFRDMTTQAHDTKSFDGDKIPTETLAAARTVVDFEAGPDAKAEEFPLEEFRRDGGIASSTSQLFWTESEERYGESITIDTPGTKAFIGFAREGDVAELGEISISPQPGFQVIFLTAQHEGKTLADDDRALLTVMARVRNTGMTFSEDGLTVVDVGEAPMLLEPVVATLDLGERPAKEVQLLDHAGNPTGETLTVSDNNTISIDGARDKTPYYQVIYED